MKTGSTEVTPAGLATVPMSTPPAEEHDALARDHLPARGSHVAAGVPLGEQQGDRDAGYLEEHHESRQEALRLHAGGDRSGGGSGEGDHRDRSVVGGDPGRIGDTEATEAAEHPKAMTGVTTPSASVARAGPKRSDGGVWRMAMPPLRPMARSR